MELRNLIFNEELHQYTDDQQTKYTSVTTVIGNLKPEYDYEFWSMYRAIDQVGIYNQRPFPEERCIEIQYLGRRQKFPLSSYYGGIIPLNVLPEIIANEWHKLKEDACDWGNSKHNYLEDTINSFSLTGKYQFNDIIHNASLLTTGISYKLAIHNQDELERSPLRKMYPIIYKYLCTLIQYGFTLYTEVRMYSAEYRIAGTCDLLAMLNGAGLILDWKTNKHKLDFRCGYYKKRWNNDRTKKIKTSEFVVKFEPYAEPLAHLGISKGMDYTLQLSAYAYICELWGITINALRICHIRPVVDSTGEIVRDYDGMRLETEPEIIKIEYRKEDIGRLFEYHKLHRA